VLTFCSNLRCVDVCKGCPGHQIEQIKWSSVLRTQVIGGKTPSGSSPKTLYECMKACLRNELCKGLDWHPTRHHDGKLCWLHGTWTSGTTNSHPEVTHYVLERTCTDNTGIMVSYSEHANII